MSDAQVETWHGCYDAGWTGLIVPAAFAHPAKMSRALVVRIFDELFAMGVLRPGDVCVDPFGGIGTTGIEAAARGVRFVGCEIEPKFVEVARQNFEKHRRDWAEMGRPQPVMVEGDSRQLREVLRLAGVACVVASPPYAGSVGSPSLGSVNKDAWGTDGRNIVVRRGLTASYGRTDGQLGALPAGSVAAVVSSPPWEAGAEGALRAGKFKDPAAFAAKMSAADGHGTRNSTTARSRLAQMERDAEKTYGDSPGQLGTMRSGAGVDAIVSSQPYEGSLHASEDGIDWSAAKRETSNGGAHQAPGASVSAAYPASPENIGNRSGDTFWSASRDIVAESYAILKPGGVAVWVTKRFCRDGKIQPFDDDWRRLCEHVGFETFLEVHASLVHREEHAGLFGPIVKTTARKSFFRRLYETKRPDNAIDYETVSFMRKSVERRPEAR